jgi:putative glutamine amidotransferase
MQVLNVHRGGTLIQDLGTQMLSGIKHDQGAPRDRPSHRVRLMSGSLVAGLANSDGALVNSHHHQGVDNVGRDLVATAWTSDGLIEALEDRRADRYVLGVQWHPELGSTRDQLSQSLFKRFVSEANRYAESRRQILV